MDLAQQFDVLHDAGAEILVVGQGTVAQSAAFRAELGLPFPVLADPERQAYRAYAVTRASWGQVATPGAVRSLAKAVTGGAGGGKTIGDGRQMPGTFVIDRAGRFVFARPSSHIGDTPVVSELVAVLDGITP